MLIRKLPTEDKTDLSVEGLFFFCDSRLYNLSVKTLFENTNIAA